jgi:proteasome alpha subunit
VEALRVAAIDFAHQEGYQRSEDDVTVQRVVAALSQPLKKAFADPNAAPFVVRSVFASVGDTPNEDGLFVLDFDGDYSVRNGAAYLAGTSEQGDILRDGLRKLTEKKQKTAQAIQHLKSLWASAMSGDTDKDFQSLTADLTPEIALLERKPSGESRFNLLEG